MFWVASHGGTALSQDPLPIAGGQHCCWKDNAIEVLNRIGRDYRIAYTSSNAIAIASAVLTDLAVGFLPESALQPGMRVIAEDKDLPRLRDAEIAIMRASHAYGGIYDALANHIVASMGNLDSKEPLALAQAASDADAATAHADDLAIVSRWFEDEEARRWLGGPDWPVKALRLVEHSASWLCRLDDGRPVGLLDCEVYDDRRASFAIAIDPALRRKGVGITAVEALIAHPSMTDVTELFAGVEEGMLRAHGYSSVAASCRSARSITRGFATMRDPHRPDRGDCRSSVDLEPVALEGRVDVPAPCAFVEREQVLGRGLGDDGEDLLERLEVDRLVFAGVVGDGAADEAGFGDADDLAGEVGDGAEAEL